MGAVQLFAWGGDVSVSRLYVSVVSAADLDGRLSNQRGCRVMITSGNGNKAEVGLKELEKTNMAS